MRTLVAPVSPERGATPQPQTHAVLYEHPSLGPAESAMERQHMRGGIRWALGLEN